jgi:NADPH-dependent 2,4-dienoyl-CoA reductase/sulfur reductase-like enzyme
MPDYTYVIVGGGMTADASAHAVREVDPTGSIGLIGAEPYPPYNRPPLSKALWKGESEQTIWRDTAATGAELHLGRRVTAIDPRGRTATDDQGTLYRFSKLLLATGGTPRRLPTETDEIIYFRTLDDYRRLRVLAGQKLHFVVMGGGFIGSEVAAALRMQDREVTMLVPEAGVSARLFPAELSSFVVEYYRQKGVVMRMGEGLARLDQRAGQGVVRTTTGGELAADVVVAGLGITPSVALAQQAGLRTDNGIVVDEFCRTSDPVIYAAGDVANFASPALRTRRRPRR